MTRLIRFVLVTLCVILLAAWLRQQSHPAGFYLVTVDDVEAAEPRLAGCLFDVLGSQMYLALLTDQRRTMDPGSRLVMFPPYLVDECNWPTYNECADRGNNVRPHTMGEECPAIFLAHVAARLDTWPGSIVGLYYAQDARFDAQLFSNPRLVLGKHTFSYEAAKRFRHGWDVSMPPPHQDSVGRLRATRSLTRSTPKHLLAFRGSLVNHPTRGLAGRLLHNVSRGVIVESSTQKGAAEDYRRLLGDSLFGLILPGDRYPYTGRFSEVVCSSAVPVLAVDGWNPPPFDELVPFSSYGVRVREDSLHLLTDLLESIPRVEVTRMHAAALKFCHTSVLNVQLQTRTMVGLMLTR